VSFIENAFDGFIGTNPEAMRKDAFIAGCRLATNEFEKRMNRLHLFSEADRWSVNDIIKDMRNETN
jgi:hypothetical protein